MSLIIVYDTYDIINHRKINYEQLLQFSHILFFILFICYNSTIKQFFNLLIMRYNYSFTTDEDQVLLDMLQFFDDMGLPDHIDSKAYDSLSDKFFKNNP